MFTIRLPWPDSSLMLSAPWEGWPAAVRVVLVALLALVPLGLLLTLYRYELRLVPRLTASALLGLRLLVFLLVLLLLCAQPVYARDRKTTLPGRVIVVVDRSASALVADTQREPADKLRLARALNLADGTDARLLEQWIADHDAKRPTRWALPDEARDDGRADRRMREHDELCKRVDELRRCDVAHRVLDKDGLDLLGRLAATHRVELYAIDRDVDELALDRLGELKPAADAKAGEGAAFTDLGAPLARALEQSGPGRGKILGVVVLTDGQHNSGEPPTLKARELGERGVPVFPVALGEKASPPDVAVVSVRGPNHTVFKDVDTDLTVRFRVSGMKAQELFVEIHREGKERTFLAGRAIQHDGTDREYRERFPVRMQDVGTQTVTATVKPIRPDPAQKETVADNNALSTTVAVADDRARVLLVDGEARWEYHYLATALGRDRLVQLKTVVFEQPRVQFDERVSEEALEKAGSPGRRWPQGPDALAGFACVLLGDVDPARLSPDDRKRLETYVADAGGTLVVLAGKRSMPLAYPERGPDGEPDPLRRLLPIEQPRVLSPLEGFPLALSRAGRDTNFMRLVESDGDETESLWAGVPRPWGWAVAGVAKPGATPLAFVPEGEAAPLDLRERRGAVVARHNYGFGRVLYVGIDSTWRWRFRAGDLHHHRFWGQVVRWAAADRPLLVGNDAVRFGTPQPVYRAGDPIEVIARFAEAAGELREQMPAGAQVFLLDERRPDDRKRVALVPLGRRPAQPRVMEGPLRSLPPGRYEVELAVPDLADKLKDKDGEPLKAAFTVLPSESVETANLARNDVVLEDMAKRSGGRVFTPLDAGELVERLEKKGVEHVEHHEQKLWLWWPILAAVVGLLTLEWIGRKTSGLP